MAEPCTTTDTHEGFLFELLTPERVVFSHEVVSAVFPGAQGQFGVLRGHVPFLTGLTWGEIRVTLPDRTVVRFAGSGGFAQVDGRKVVALAETAERADEIDPERAQRSRDRALERLSQRNNVDVSRAQISLMRALTRLRIAGKIQ